MAENKPVSKSPQKDAKGGWTAAEREAMRARAREVKAEAAKKGGESDLLAAIAAMPPGDRAIAKRVHQIVMASAPGLSPKTWYGMPAYAKDGKVVCFFQAASKFEARYGTLGFNDAAKLDSGAMWPTAFAVIELTAAVESKIAALVKKAVR